MSLQVLTHQDLLAPERHIMLASQNLFEFIQSFDVDGPNILTDHCCISLNLEFPLYDATLADEICLRKCKWKIFVEFRLIK